ncbi:ATP-binding protein [Sphingobacterium sp. lm-10]|uniref:sensor histidine kinase n=1 Tax=Sphingobacterium sp. lm-10 TaxID=2944904 RepID=UPI00202144E4|nr:ATP-binding protein [Sphingobacterium sp. lm-10]MCL7986949.1 ATP-binding protein [Sphingobacterium sp. lm-10]
MHFEESYTLKHDNPQKSAKTLDYTLFFLDSSGFVISYNGEIEKFLPEGIDKVHGLSFLELIGAEDTSAEMREQVIRELIVNGRSRRRIHLNNDQGAGAYSVGIATLRDGEEHICGFAMLIVPSVNMDDTVVVDMISEIKDYAIFRLNTEGNVENWNRGAERIKGYYADEIVGKNFSLFYTEEDRIAGMPSALLERARSKGSANTTGWRVRKDGGRFWGTVTITAIHDREGLVIGFSKVTRDLTDEHNAEISLSELHRQLIIKTHDVEQFTFAASHDLLSPAHSIISVSGLLRETLQEKLRDEDLYLFQAIEDSAGRIIQMLKTLLDHLKLDGNSAKESCNLTEIVDHVKMDLRVQILDTKAVITCSDLPVVNGHATFLYQLFQNLLSNALKFRREESIPEIQIEANDEGEHWLFRVIDNGIGIADKDRERIFTLFQRLHSEEVYTGSGIGLTTSQKIVELHGGEIWVESKFPEGSIILFTLSK